MSELADELARRMEPEHLKAIAADKVTDLKAQARERATEKVDEIKANAKEAVMRKTTDIKERADTPKGWSMLGAILGAGVGSMLMKKAFDVRSHSESHTRMYGGHDMGTPELVPAPEGGLMRPTGDVRGMSSDIGVRTSTDVGYTNTGMGMSTDTGVSTGDNMKARASDVMDTAKDKASMLKDRASGLVDRAKDKASGLREHIPDRGMVKARTTDWYSTVSDNPVLVAIGGIALGALFAGFIPVTDRERQLIQPAKAKVKDQISSLGDQLETKLSGQSTDVSGQDDEIQASAATESENERGTIPPLPPLDDFNTSVH
ncbi:MAG TPA: hypothetical protein VF794_08485 [Archangium sp.]|jgi:ElaB/YqjD/DUF883 family membrane-anchored ribosome-binding protein|uniref:hypothetical protein n=1 Tax=Archangium sp. TaxID=1872627 RepID=UPI002EDA9CB8